MLPQDDRNSHWESFDGARDHQATSLGPPPPAFARPEAGNAGGSTRKMSGKGTRRRANAPPGKNPEQPDEPSVSKKEMGNTDQSNPPGLPRANKKATAQRGIKAPASKMTRRLRKKST